MLDVARPAGAALVVWVADWEHARASVKMPVRGRLRPQALGGAAAWLAPVESALLVVAVMSATPEPSAWDLGDESASTLVDDTVRLVPNRPSFKAWAEAVPAKISGVSAFNGAANGADDAEVAATPDIRPRLRGPRDPAHKTDGRTSSLLTP